METGICFDLKAVTLCGKHEEKTGKEDWKERRARKEGGGNADMSGEMGQGRIKQDETGNERTDRRGDREGQNNSYSTMSA